MKRLIYTLLLCLLITMPQVLFSEIVVDSAGFNANGALHSKAYTSGSKSNRLSSQGFNINLGKSTLNYMANHLDILALSISFYGQDEKGILSMSDLTSAELDNTPGQLVGQVLCYPNPFRLTEGTIVGYRLNKAMDVDIHIYNMRGHRVFENQLQAGGIGAKGGSGDDGYNRLEMNLDSYNDLYLPAGVYLLVLIHDNKVIGKTKMAVIP